jgi:hypothetical protein
MLGLGLVAAVVGLTAFTGWWLARPLHRINRDGFDQIQVGMSQREVEVLLGGPPGNYPNASYLLGDSTPITHSIPPESDVSDYRSEAWSAGQRTVQVYLHADGTVADKEFTDCRLPSPSVWQRLRRWLGR